MVDTAYIVKSTSRRAFIGSFHHFAYIYFCKSVCISNCGGVRVGGGGRAWAEEKVGVSSKSYLLPSFICHVVHVTTCLP